MEVLHSCFGKNLLKMLLQDKGDGSCFHSSPSVPAHAELHRKVFSPSGSAPTVCSFLFSAFVSILPWKRNPGLLGGHLWLLPLQRYGCVIRLDLRSSPCWTSRGAAAGAGGAPSRLPGSTPPARSCSEISTGTTRQSSVNSREQPDAGGFG